MRVTLHRKKLARLPPNFWGTLKPPGQAGATFIKFRGKMTHFRQGLRSGGWLTSAPARGHSLILLALCGLAVTGWIAVSDGLIDRNGKPLGTDFSNVTGTALFAASKNPVGTAVVARRCRHTAGAAGAAGHVRVHTAAGGARSAGFCGCHPRNRASVILICSGLLAESSTRLQCNRGFRVFPPARSCDPSASASLFSRVAG